jgi:hypothetical protein
MHRAQKPVLQMKAYQLHVPQLPSTTHTGKQEKEGTRIPMYIKEVAMLRDSACGTPLTFLVNAHAVQNHDSFRLVWLGV